MASCYTKLNMYDEAEELHYKALQIRKNKLGERSKMAASSYFNIGKSLNIRIQYKH